MERLEFSKNRHFQHPDSKEKRGGLAFFASSHSLWKSRVEKWKSGALPYSFQNSFNVTNFSFLLQRVDKYALFTVSCTLA